MPPPIANPESLEELPFPMHGLNLIVEFEAQPQGTTPIGTNVRAYETLTQRGRGGSRPGLVKYIGTQVLGFRSKIQHLNIIVDPTTPFLIANDEGGQDGDFLDPSTNNRRIRNPGRYLKKRGSGRQLNIHIKGKGPPKPPNPPSATYTVNFQAHVSRAVGGGVFGPQSDSSTVGPGGVYTHTLTVMAPDGTVFAVMGEVDIDAGNNITKNQVTVSPPGAVKGWIGVGTIGVDPI